MQYEKFRKILKKKEKIDDSGIPRYLENENYWITRRVSDVDKK